MGDAEVSIISKKIVQPSQITIIKETGVKRIHFTPWDSQDAPYSIQCKMASSSASQQTSQSPTSSPLSLKLSTTSIPSLADSSQPPNRTTQSQSLSTAPAKASFIHASAPHVTVSDIQKFYYVPVVVNSFFPLNGVLGYYCYSQPLIGVQVSEPADGVFMACSINHFAADGTTFWQFIKTWSTICPADNNSIEVPPVFDH